MAWKHAKDDGAGHRSASGRDAERGAGRIAAVLVIATLLLLILGGGALAVLGRGGVAALIPRIPKTSGQVAAPQSQPPATTPLAIVKSPTDYNGNGIDDTTDIVIGARKDAEAEPAYDDGYYAGGYPPADRGACTDLVWRAFREAGYDLKAMVDADVAAHPQAYRAVAPKPDPNIDFRRTGVLDVFFKRYGQSLTTDPTDHAQWQPGDIVTFETTKHIAVVSDRASRVTGTPYLLHNMGVPGRDNDYLDAPNRMAVSGHYRFDAAKVPADVLRAWKG